MASPFKLFRKHQKTAFVLLGIMAMISFIILPIFLQNAGRGRGVVTFATTGIRGYRKITNMNLQNITSEFSNLARFYDQLHNEIIISHQMRCIPLENMLGQLRSMSEEQAVDQWLVAQFMRNEGHTITREEVGDFLNRLTINPITQQSYVNEGIYRKAADAVSLSDRNITYLVGNQLLIDQFFSMSEMSMRSLTPETEFDWYNRFNRMMKIEAIPVSVSDFTSQVPIPTQKELKKFFQDNQFRDRNPQVLESGFGVPMMVRAEYVYYDKDMLNQVEVTDEEIEKYYEENKERYVERPYIPTPGMSGIPNAGGAGTFGSLRPAMSETAPSSDETTTTPDSQADVTMPIIDLTPPPSDDAAPSEDSEESESEEIVVPDMPTEVPPPQIDESDTDEETTDEAATDEITEDTADDTPPTDEGGDTVEAPDEETAVEEAIEEEVTAEEETTGWNQWKVPIRLVSYQTDAEEQSDNTIPVQQENDEPAAPETGTPDTSENETPVVIIPQTPVIPPSFPGGMGGSLYGGGRGTQPYGGMGSGLGGTNYPLLTPPIPNMRSASTNPALASTPADMVFYRPLDDDLKTEIRDIIARQKMDAKLMLVQEAMNEYYKEHIEYTKSVQQKKVKLALPDLAALAGKNGLKYVNLSHVDSHDLVEKDYDFANSYVVSNNNLVRVHQAIFMNRGVVTANSGYRSYGYGNGVDYLFWITEINEAKIPEYSNPGVAEQVEARWRQVEARGLAKEKAEELAKVAKQAEGSLLEHFSANPNKDVKAVVDTEFFSWLEYTFSQDYERLSAVRWSEVRETGVMPRESLRNNTVLKNLGLDFMQTVYNLELGGIAVTYNEPQDTFYVVRLVEVAPSEDRVFDSFSSATQKKKDIYNPAALQDRQIKVQQGAMKKVFEQTKFQWKLKPSEFQQQERLRQQKNPNDRRQQDDRNIPPNIPQF